MSSATVEAGPVGPTALVSRIRRGFRAWRRTRPFWGGLFAIAASVPILYLPYGNISLGGLTIALATTAGAGSLIIGLMLIALGLTAWFQPMVRVFCGVATTVLALVSLPISNFGGLGLGLVLGLLAGGMLVSWAPLQAEPETAEATATAAEGDAPTAQLPAQAAPEQPLQYGAVPRPSAEEEQR
ncbi:DUF6114 domain-containing protein [Kitasatospora phosalacinea]|uniref:DUF6114 domain-containing protein n=1 Tax=Kitasatospora phosalacinea TaxID=2065 RepID=UPI000527CC9A|nr:DUF6114 domain-containing protein [Kitasatospora phosalacinea]